jgi:hypothetical protein
LALLAARPTALPAFFAVSSTASPAAFGLLASAAIGLPDEFDFEPPEEPRDERDFGWLAERDREPLDLELLAGRDLDLVDVRFDARLLSAISLSFCSFRRAPALLEGLALSAGR